MKSVSLCHAVADRPFAEELAAFLEVNFPFRVSLQDAVIGDGCDVLDATERALSAEVAIVVLSPASVPAQLDLERWKDVFIDQPKQIMTHLGFVLRGDCPFPKLLRRERFFDATGNRLAAMRDIKRWLLRPNESRATRTVEAEEIRRAIADRPAVLVDVDAVVASRFADQCEREFEEVYRLDCRGLGRAGVIGEIASAAGPLGDESRRVLFVMSGVAPQDRDAVPVTGRASAIFVDFGVVEGAIPNPASDAWRLFQGAPTLADGWNAVKLLKEASRFEEAVDVLSSMREIAAGDSFTLGRVEREMFWVRADLDFAAAGPVAPLDSGAVGQLSFVFV